MDSNVIMTKLLIVTWNWHLQMQIKQIVHWKNCYMETFSSQSILIQNQKNCSLERETFQAEAVLWQHLQSRWSWSEEKLGLLRPWCQRSSIARWLLEWWPGWKGLGSHLGNSHSRHRTTLWRHWSPALWDGQKPLNSLFHSPLIQVSTVFLSFFSTSNTCKLGRL